MGRKQLLVGLGFVFSIGCGPELEGPGATDDDDDTNGDVSDDDDTVADDDDSTWDGPCPDLMQVRPSDGTTGLFGSEVEATWELVPPLPSIVVTGPDGPVSGTLVEADGGRGRLFVADAPFAASTTFTVSASAGCEAEESEFTTGPWGAPATDPSAMIGPVFTIDVGLGEWSPSGTGAIAQGFLNGLPPPLFTLTSDSDLPAGVAHVRWGHGAGDVDGVITQDTQCPTNYVTGGQDQVVGTPDDLPGAWADPWVSFVGGRWDVTCFSSADLTFESVGMDAAIAPDGSSWRGTLFGRVDTRSFSSGLDVCTDLAVADIDCVPCVDGELLCLDLAVEGAGGERVPGLTGLQGVP